MSETTPVRVYGASDDLFELDTPDRSIYEEYYTYHDEGYFAKLTAPNGDSIVVRGEYGPGYNGGWLVEVYGENNPGWKVEKSDDPERDNGDILTIHVPVGTKAEEIDPL